MYLRRSLFKILSFNFSYIRVDHTLIIFFLVLPAGERRIRVHTLCLPIGSNLPDILHSADQQCIIGLLTKMGKHFILNDEIFKA